tara:strand:+ start:3337 stop:4041 length:705 start_codon:yes stop_codon:yes gene_type:complete
MTKNNNQLKVALPSKGRLRKDLDKLFVSKNINLSSQSNDRSYLAKIDGVEEILVYFLSAKEITGRLEEGSVHIGLTCDDLVQEKIRSYETKIEKLLQLDFGKADLVVAIPNLWIDVISMADLEEVSNFHRLKTSKRLRVATKYPFLTNQFFSKRGVVDYRTIESHGSTESAPFNGFSDIITDITSTGETLKANNLRVLDDGLILKSAAGIFKSKVADWNNELLNVSNNFLNKIN